MKVRHLMKNAGDKAIISPANVISPKQTASVSDKAEGVVVGRSLNLQDLAKDIAKLS